jgi:cysteinyl-tRNA synthetase
MIAIIDGLIAKGYAYPAAGDVYFDVTRDPDYGKLCNRDPEQLEAGARVEANDKKRNPGDFALWKGAKPGEPQWDSPWGPGRPGWHIECSAMSMKYLGTTLDVHGGGLDLQFPHHENELAQSESYTGRTFSRYWMHNGLLKMGNTKMAGSVGNVINVVDLLKQHQPETVRFLLLGTHYRSPIEWSDERLSEVKRSLQAFYRFFERHERVRKKSFFDLQPAFRRDRETTRLTQFRPEAQEILTLRERFLECMDDDFNTGGAIGWLHSLLVFLNRLADAGHLEDAVPGHTVPSPVFDVGVGVLRELSAILGLFREAPQTSKGGGDDQLVNGLMQLLIELRTELRKAKNFALADQIRKRLGELGVTLEDRPGGTGWRVG